MQRVIETGEFAFYPIILINKDLKVLYVNSKVEALIGIPAKEALGNKIHNVFPIRQNDLKMFLEQVKKVVTTISRTSTRIHIEVTHAGITEEKTFFVQLEPTINNLTGEYCVLLTLLDITEALKFERIKEEYVKRSQMYLNILTHDIYNILFAISGYYEIIQSKLPIEDEEISKRIKNLIIRGTKIVQNIRLLSRILDTTIIKEPVRIPIKTLITEVLTKLRDELIEEGITLEYSTNLNPNARPLGGALLSSFFTILFRTLVMLTEKTRLELVITDKINESEGAYSLIISFVAKEELIGQLIETINKVSKIKKIRKENLEITILFEILRRYNYKLSIRRGEKSDVAIIQIDMPTYATEQMDV